MFGKNATKRIPILVLNEKPLKYNDLRGFVFLYSV
jgi:hypothetical protein